MPSKPGKSSTQQPFRLTLHGSRPHGSSSDRLTFALSYGVRQSVVLLEILPPLVLISLLCRRLFAATLGGAL